MAAVSPWRSPGPWPPSCAAPILAWVVVSGIRVSDAQDLLANLHLPTRLYGAFNVGALSLVPLLFVVACQIAAIIPALRIRRLQPVEALRVDG